MDSLKSYFSIIDPRLLSHVKGKTGEFIRIFQEQEYISEAAFRQRICGEKHNRNYYQELKTRTLRILQALAITSTLEGNSLVKKKYDFCLKKFTIGQKFLNQGQRKEGLRLIKQAYKIAIGFDFVHLACEITSILYHNHIYYHPHSGKAAFYFQQSKQYQIDYLAEKAAEHQFYHIIGQLKGIGEPKQFEEAISEVEQWKGKSLKYKVYISMIKVLHGMNTANYDLVIDSCNDALHSFEKKKGVYSSHFYFFYYYKAISSMAIARFEDANSNFILAEKFTVAKSTNDYLLRLYRTINALHSGHYQTAYDLYRKNRYCKYEEIREQFTIIEAYMYFLSQMGYLQLDRPFRIGKYFNETIKAQSDKQGNNIIIIIAELLYYLAKDKGKFIDRVEAINNYSYRYITGKDTRRAKRFIKILCTLPVSYTHLTLPTILLV